MPESLRQIPLFAQLAPAPLQALWEASVMRDFKAGEVILREGQLPEGILYFLVEGGFQVSKLAPSGKEVILRLITAAEAFGLAALFDDGPFPATLAATDAARVLLLPASAFFEILQQDPALTRRVLALLSGRVREAYERLFVMATTKARARLAHLILTTSVKGGAEPDGEGGLRLNTPLTYATLARMAGITYEETARIMQEWAGFLDYRRGAIHVRDPERLKAMLGSDGL